MANPEVIEFLTFFEPVACLTGLVLVYKSRQIRQFVFLASFLVVRAFSDISLLPFVYYNPLYHHISHKLGYTIYFYIYWSSFAVEAILGFGIILSIYKLAMAPLKGLQKLGMLMFRWAAGIAVAVAFTVALGPKVSGIDFLERAISQLQQTQSVLTLCMLLFVCLAVRPMGLSYRSKIFGVSFGLGLLSTTNLVQASWFTQNRNFMSLYEVINAVAVLATIAIWSVYFALPEPRRRMIVLPTTSPFLRWNQISLALGDEPGFVAIGDVTPDMFAPAEVEVMRRASEKMRRLAT